MNFPSNQNHSIQVYLYDVFCNLSRILYLICANQLVFLISIGSERYENDLVADMISDKMVIRYILNQC
jgi:hypothetical protein